MHTIRNAASTGRLIPLANGKHHALPSGCTEDLDVAASHRVFRAWVASGELHASEHVVVEPEPTGPTEQPEPTETLAAKGKSSKA